MLGRVFLMEFRTGWKGLLLFLIIVAVVAGGMPKLWPTFLDIQEEALEGQARLNLTIHEGEDEASLSWESVANASTYMVLEDNRSYMLSPRIVYAGPETEVVFDRDPEVGRYYAVLALIQGSTEPILVGITSSEAEALDPFSQLMENPFYQSFSGGRIVSIYDLRGFLSLEMFSWWIFLAGLYLAYVSVSTVAADFQEKRMDIILSTPISRRRYIFEKWAAQAAIALLSILAAAAITIGAVNTLAVENDLRGEDIFLSWFGSLPMLLVIQGIAILSAVRFMRSKVAIGITFLFIFIEFAFFTIVQLAKNLEGLKYLTIIHYWDYNSVMFDGLFKVGDFFVLLATSLFLLAATLWLFSRKDIPV